MTDEDLRSVRLFGVGVLSDQFGHAVDRGESWVEEVGVAEGDAEGLLDVDREGHDGEGAEPR
ncbi:hypothetical protein ABTX85_20815 [Streptomyces sp. NPDC096097]|uniref:hypothetical protein n=1 Tax=Streptomyces sp. NPDC096097 TaxID=3155546 RepID=UPI003323ECAC